MSELLFARAHSFRKGLESRRDRLVDLDLSLKDETSTSLRIHCRVMNADRRRPRPSEHPDSGVGTLGLRRRSTHHRPVYGPIISYESQAAS